jgi:hypothetical protein
MGLARGRHSRIHARNCACKERSVKHSAPQMLGLAKDLALRDIRNLRNQVDRRHMVTKLLHGRVMRQAGKGIKLFICRTEDNCALLSFSRASAAVEPN